MRFFLPAGSARFERPIAIHRYTFEDFLEGIARKKLPLQRQGAIVPLESVAPGDVQVLAAHDPQLTSMSTIELDVLADFPSVDSVVASAGLRTGRELPHIRELLLDSHAPLPDPATLHHLSGLESLYALRTQGGSRLDLASLPAEQMRKLAVSRWSCKSITPLERMRAMRKLRLDLFRESLDVISGMDSLEYLHVRGPAKGWATLRACTGLKEAHLIEVQISNLRRLNTWRHLRVLILAGRGVRSLAGLENCRMLEELTLINLSLADLSPLRELAALRKLTLRMADSGMDLAAIAGISGLKSFTIDSSATDAAPVRLPTIRPLASASALEELTLRETTIEDGDLTPLLNLPKLRKVHLHSRIGGDVELLRAARPDLEIYHAASNLRLNVSEEIVGGVTLQRPGFGLQQWSIFQSLAPALGLPTNYDAERCIKSNVKKRDRELAKRLEWDTEAGALGIYAAKEEDIRAVAEIINEVLAAKGRRQPR